MPPPQSRDRYHSSPRSSGYAGRTPQRYAKKEESRYTGGKRTNRAEASAFGASTAPSSSAPQNVREDALKEALAKALTNPHATAGTSNAHSEVDTYGNGSPTDRLQFGYSPAVAAEAVAFHSRFAPQDWVADRRRNGHLTLVKKQKLSPLNCEPITSTLKLQRHWKKINAFNTDVHGGSSKLKAADLDRLLDMLASKQRIGEEEE